MSHRWPSAPVSTRQRLSAVAVGSVGAMVLSLLSGTAPAVATPATAAAVTSPGVSDVRVGLIQLGTALAAAAEQPALSEDLPLTDVSVRDVLKLDTAIGTEVQKDLATHPDTTLDTLPSAFPAGGTLVVEKATPSAGAPAGSREWLLKVNLAAAVPVALTYQDDRLQFGASQLDGELAGRLTGTIRFRYDPSEVALRTFAVVGSSLLTTHLWTRATGTTGQVGTSVDIPPFQAVDGFVQLDAEGTAKIDTTTALTLRDPNGRGLITTEDLEFSSADELFTTTTPPGPDDVAIQVDLSTDLDSAATGTVTVGTRAAGAKTSYAAPAVARSDALQDLTALTRSQALTGFTEYSSAVLAAEGAADQEFPLLDLSLSDLFSPGHQLLGLLTEQATATITCGAANTSPPSGAPRPGQVRYCQATTTSFEAKAGTAITWESPDDGVTIVSPNGGAGTVGRAPTANVAVSGGGGFPVLRVTFTGSEDGTVHHARTVLTSIQDLGRAVAGLGLDGSLTYDQTTRALQVAVRQSSAAAKTVTAATGGNGNLAPLTGLNGLCQAVVDHELRSCPPTGDNAVGAAQPASGSASLTSSNRLFQADFGIGLVPPAAAPVDGAKAPATPVFYVKPASSGVLYQVGTVTATLPTHAPLVARIGFLQVDVDVSSYSLSQTGTAASVKVDTSGGVKLPSNGTVSGAVGVDRLLAVDPATAVVPEVTRGLSAQAGLTVNDSFAGTAASHTRPIGATGTIAATWADLLPDTLPSVRTGGQYDELRLLDIVPAREATTGAGSGDGKLVDPAADFFTEFGVDASVAQADRTVTRQLYDLGATGSSSTVCTAFTVTDTHTLTCTAGPLAAAGILAPGQSYLINGDPEALRDLLVEDLSGVLASYVNDDAPGADQTFPLVDVQPTEISAARDDLGTAIVRLQDQVTTAKPDPAFPISSLQDFSTTLGALLPSSVGGGDSVAASSAGFTLTHSASGVDRLVLDTSLSTTGTRPAPLRVAVGPSELRVIRSVANGVPQVAKVNLAVASQAHFVIGVDLADASSAVRGDTDVTEQVTGLSDGATAAAGNLAGLDAEYASSMVKTAGSGITLGIGVQADTEPAASGSSAWTALAAFPASLTQTRSVVGTPQTCGSPAAGHGPIAACLDLPLTDKAGAAASTVHVALTADQSSGGSGGALTKPTIAYRFLTDGLSGLDQTLGDALDGDNTLDADGAPLSMPLVGTNLDAGADVPGDVTAYVTAARAKLTAVEGSVKETDTPASLQSALKTALDSVTVPDVSIAKATVTLSCAPAASCSGKTVADVSQISVPLSLSGALPEAQPVPFQVGPAGATIRTDLKVPVTTTWTLGVTVGIGRGTGPFVKLDTPAARKVLTVHVGADLATYDAKTNACHSWSRQPLWKATVPTKHDFTNLDVPSDHSTSARCIDAFVGKLPAVLVDRPTGADLSKESTALKTDIDVTVTPPSGTTGGLTYLPALYDRDVTFATTATGSGDISVYFETFASEVGFFDVMGTIDLAWEDGAYTSDLQFGLLDIDATTLNNAVLPGFDKAKKYLAPLNPVVDTLSRPIPVVSELSQAVGGDPVTLLSLLPKGTKLDLVLNLLQLQNLVADGPDDGTHRLVPIGAEGTLLGFKVSPSRFDLQSCTETVADNNKGTTFERKTDGSGASGRCQPGAITKAKQAAKGTTPPKDAKGIDVEKTVTSTKYFSLPSVSVPVLQDTNQIFNLLLDSGDATMLYVDLGHAGVSKQVVRNFGPFFVGPVPVSASIGGALTFDGRFAFGFDTRGLSRKIEALDPGDIAGFEKLKGTNISVFSDGFYIDDLENGVDVPEISLSFTITAGAAVSIGFAEAGIQGGVTLDLSLDAFDPNGDGKIYTDEFAGTANGPDCVFNVSSGLTFFLQFFFSVDLLFYSYSKSYDIVRSPRIKLFEFNCAVQDPVLATYAAPVRSTDPTKAVPPVLTLTIGDPTARKAYKDVEEEKYTVRQIGNPTTGSDPHITLQVSAFNLVQNFDVPADTVVRGDAGSGADTIRMYPMPALVTGADGQPSLPDQTAKNYVPTRFVAPADIDGGSGSDDIETGDGDDVVDGGGDNDTLSTGAGDDTVTGGGGTDLIEAGQGSDSVSGGDGDDRLSGGAGADEVRGDAGDDVVDGGTGADPAMLFPTASADTIRPLLDAGDLVVGGDGSDTVTGGDGSDIVVGGAYPSTAATYAATQTTTVYGLDSLNQIQQVDVPDITTVVTPTLASVRAQCAVAGSASDTGQDTVSGGGDDDDVIGGAGSDNLSGGAGDDVVCGRGGDDVLDGDGLDVPVDQQGDDEVRGGPGRDRVYGSGGADDLHGDAGDDLVRGGDGDDTLTGGAGADLLLGESGRDTVDGDGDGATSVAADSASNGRSIVCNASTSIIGGRIDLNGDLSGTGDFGQLEGLPVQDGYLRDPNGAKLTGIVSGVVFNQGQADLDGNGTIEQRTTTVLGDTGSVPLAGMSGAAGNGDCILGGDGADTALDGQLGADYVDAGAGDDTDVHGGDGDDLVRGGDGNDTVHGDAGNDLVAGDADQDVLFGDAGADDLRGGSGNDLLAGGSPNASAVDGADEVLGDGGDDVVLGGNALLSRTALAGTAIAGVGVTLLATPVAATGLDDQVYGGYGDDWVFGQAGNDQTFGGPGSDVVEGGPGSDLVQGDDGDDLLVGGSSTTGQVTLTRSAAGTADGDDTVVGDQGVDGLDGSDVMVGDNARLQPAAGAGRSRWARIRPDVEIALFDLPTSSAPAAATSGADTMSGGGADDLILGQSGDDTISGGDGDDGIEGNAGADVVHGGLGDDEVLGGSWTSGSYDAAGGDTLYGDDGDDVLLGDNATPVTTGSPYVVLGDAPAPGGLSPASTYGNDAIAGGTGDDLVFGQSGNDVLEGDDGIDLLEGDAGADRLSGGADDDMLTGGSSSADGVISPDRTAEGMLDAGDALAGGSGDDVLAGDNARIDRTGLIRGDGTSLRSVQLFDVVTASRSVPAGVGAGDTMLGDDGRDLLFGQAGNDSISGGDDDDYLEGEVGSDTLSGDDGQDDLVGGGSSDTGALLTVDGTQVTDRLLTPVTAATDKSAAGLVDGNDVLDGGDASDVLLGDNGRITRDGPNVSIAGGGSGVHVVRQVAMADQGPGVWAGSDRLAGGAGDDELYGQFDDTLTSRAKQAYLGQPVAGDVLSGGSGDDALVGDQGVDVPTPAAHLGAPGRTISDDRGFVHELIRPLGSLVRVVTLSQSTLGGDDVLLGGDGFDSIHAGAGKDVVNAGAGDDVVFGDSGSDALWGGTGHDRLFGGSGSDLLDIKRRTQDPRLWQVSAPVEDTDRIRHTVNGRDVLYGGSGADAMQADVGDTGTSRRMQGDRLVDWRSTTNYFKVCASGFGAGKVQNLATSSMTSLLRQLAAATGSVGPVELSIPVGEGVSAYPGRGTFVCETG